MSKRAASSRWYKTQSSDPFVKRREQAGLRSRAAFKLQELIDRDRLCRPGQVVLDLGASPGGWSEIAKGKVGPTGKVVAVDMLPMAPLSGVEFILGDALSPEVGVALRECLNGRTVDLVLSDMAPNLTGIRFSDEARALELAELALTVAQDFLRPHGTMLVKLFQHPDTEDYVRGLKRYFAQVVRRKPEASRAASREYYVVARDFQL